eukprot:1154121-Pelagomonas_calceolata.AAC.2
MSFVADDDQPAWMSPEPVQPVKMTPADIERERQAFREQHNRAKQAAAQKAAGHTAGSRALAFAIRMID